MVTSTAPVLVKVHPPSGTIVLNRPDRRNALTRRMLAELAAALDDLYNDQRVRAIILTGSAPAFCAGMDLGEMKAQPHSRMPNSAGATMQNVIGTSCKKC